MTHHATTNDRPATITSKSVSEGHPDRVCDCIADSILDAYLAKDPHSRVACDVLCKCNRVVVAGEVSSLRRTDYEHVDEEAATRFVKEFDFRPGEIIRQLDLLRPIYRLTTNYGHFGRPGLPWESARGH